MSKRFAAFHLMAMAVVLANGEGEYCENGVCKSNMASGSMLQKLSSSKAYVNVSSAETLKAEEDDDTCEDDKVDPNDWNYNPPEDEPKLKNCLPTVLEGNYKHPGKNKGVPMQCYWTQMLRTDTCKGTDFIFLIDSSRSIGQQGWEKSTTFAKQVLSELQRKNSPDNKFALITFSTESEINIQKKFSEVQSNDIDALKYMKQHTQTAAAFKDATTVAKDMQKGRTIAMLLTDGNPTVNLAGETDFDSPDTYIQEATEEAKKLKKEDVRLIVVGVGNEVNTAVMRDEWATSPGDYIALTDFAKLKDIVDDIAGATCTLPCPKDTRKSCGKSASWMHKFYRQLNSLVGREKDAGLPTRGNTTCYCQPNTDLRPKEQKNVECTYHCGNKMHCVQFTDAAPNFRFGTCVPRSSDALKCKPDVGIYGVLFGGSCFERGTSTLASSSPFGPWTSKNMEDVQVSEHVLASHGTHGKVFVDQVWTNLHRNDESLHQLLDIEHSKGAVSTTLDHVLVIDGQIQPARNARLGSQLRMVSADGEVIASTVSKVTQKLGRIINPVTTSGFILAADSDGRGVLATTVTDSPKNVMLDVVRMPSLGKLSSSLYPAEFQASSALEAIVMLGGALCTFAPATLAWVLCFLVDNMVGTAFIAANSSLLRVVMASWLLISFKRKASTFRA